MFLLLFLPLFSKAQNPCIRPNLNVPQSILCQNILNWDKLSRDTPVANGRAGAFSQPLGDEAKGGPPGAAGAPWGPQAGPMPETIYDCMDIPCVCSFVQGAKYVKGVCTFPDGSVYDRALRKEYRMMTDDERNLYVQGFITVRQTIYNTLSLIHSTIKTSPAAHGGPAFLPWHREFLKRLEIGIRTTSVNGGYPFIKVGIPFWDSSMDGDLVYALGISAKNSITYSSELMGSVYDGYLKDGLFGGFQGTKGWVTRVLDQWPAVLNLIKRSDVDAIIFTHTLNQVLGATAGGMGCPMVPTNSLELIHGDSHVWMGGDMLYTQMSTNDPMFFMHHSFIDYIFEQWRLKHQTRSERESQYNTGPTFCYSDAHKADSAMVPFTNFVNQDGLSNGYTDNMYAYMPRPICNSTIVCPSRYYFCNLNLGRCVSRIKVNSKCKTIKGVDPCYKSVCSDQKGNYGNCTAAAMGMAVGAAPPLSAPVQITPDRLPPSCFNRQPCCQSIADSSSCADINFRTQCPASCKTCTPNYSLQDDCSNRHPLCNLFMRREMCKTQPEWMAENCRKECDLCSATRSEGCEGKIPPMPPPNVPIPPGLIGGPPGYQAYPPGYSEGVEGSPSYAVAAESTYPTAPPESKSCYNNDRCCGYWAKTNGCYKNTEMMATVCKASCTCNPIFDLSKCSNFIKQCPIYASKGLCWLEFIKENCRRSCNSCLSTKQEEKQCATR